MGGKRSHKSGASIVRCAKGQRVQSGVSDDRGRDRVVVQPGESRPWAIASSSPPGPAARTPSTGGASVVQCDTVSDAARRVAIATYFLEAMDAPPASEDSETAAWIRKEWKMPPGSLNVIKRVLVAVRACAVEGVEYTDARAVSNRMKCASIQLDSVAADIIAESMEDVAGIRRAHKDVCAWLRRRHESGEQNVLYWDS